MLMVELPADDPARGFVTCRMADACAKGGAGRKYWMPRRVLTAVLHYAETRRAAAVRAAREAGVYDRMPQARVLVAAGRTGRLVLRDRDGRESVVALNALTPKARARLLRETPQGLEPVMLWLNEDGTPRAKRGWYRTFDGVNARVAPEHP